MTDLYDDCPVKPPKLLRADSIVETCGCGKWIQRYPAFMGDDDSFWQCENCGRTWINRRPGRPYGPKSKEWAWVQKQFNDLYLDIFPTDRDTVVCDPPLESLDWNAVEQWFRSKGIYRVFISVSMEEVEQ